MEKFDTNIKDSNLYIQEDNIFNKQHIYNNNTNILYVIKQKMKVDSELFQLIKLFASENNDDIEKIKLTEKILICLTDADSIEVHSKGNFINAKHLYVLETLDKLNLISFSKKCFGHVYSELELADLINKEFENLKIEIYAKLMHQIYLEKHSIFIKNSKKDNVMNSIIKESYNNKSAYNV